MWLRCLCVHWYDFWYSPGVPCLRADKTSPKTRKIDESQTHVFAGHNFLSLLANFCSRPEKSKFHRFFRYWGRKIASPSERRLEIWVASRAVRVREGQNFINNPSHASYQRSKQETRVEAALIVAACVSSVCCVFWCGWWRKWKGINRNCWDFSRR